MVRRRPSRSRSAAWPGRARCRQLAADLRGQQLVQHVRRRQLELHVVRRRRARETCGCGTPRPAATRRSPARTSSCAAGRRPSARPAASPMMPRDSTNAFLCGHMFCEAYHSPRLAKLNTAICDLPYLIVAPPSIGKSSTVPTRTHASLRARPRLCVDSACRPSQHAETAPATRTRSASRPAGVWPRSGTISMHDSVSSRVDELPEPASAFRDRGPRPPIRTGRCRPAGCIIASSSAAMPSLSWMTTSRRWSMPPSSFSQPDRRARQPVGRR